MRIPKTRVSSQAPGSTVPVKAKGLTYVLNAPLDCSVSRMNGTKVRYIEPGHSTKNSRGIEYAPFAYVDLNLSDEGQRQTMIVKQEWLSYEI